MYLDERYQETMFTRSGQCLKSLLRQMKKKVHMDEVPLLELMTEHCLKIAALIFYCALDCLIKKSALIRKSSIGFVRVSLLCYRKARSSAFRGRHVTAKHSN